VVATKIQAGMIHAGQTVTVAADGQFRLVTGGKTVTVVLRTTTSGIHTRPGGVRFWEWNGMGAAGRRQPRSEAVTVPGRMPLTCRNVVQQRVADVRALFGTKRPTMDTGIATYGVPGSGQKMARAAPACAVLGRDGRVGDGSCDVVAEDRVVDPGKGSSERLAPRVSTATHR
jgi:hypothetical protein